MKITMDRSYRPADNFCRPVVVSTRDNTARSRKVSRPPPTCKKWANLYPQGYYKTQGPIV
jgi:hypothetical protein